VKGERSGEAAAAELAVMIEGQDGLIGWLALAGV
jgi:hypothetical protein